MTNDSELERLLQDRFAISTTQFKAVLRLFPASRPWAASLIEDEGCVLDDADFGETRDAQLLASKSLDSKHIWPTVRQKFRCLTCRRAVFPKLTRLPSTTLQRIGASAHAGISIRSSRFLHPISTDKRAEHEKFTAHLVNEQAPRPTCQRGGSFKRSPNRPMVAEMCAGPQSRRP